MAKHPSVAKFGAEEQILPSLDLVEIQKSSYNGFLKEGIAQVLAEISPVEDFTGKNFVLEVGKVTLDAPKHTQEVALEKGLNYDAPLRVEVKLTNKQTGETITQEVFLCDLPVQLPKGSFIINGIERVIVNQLVRAPGVYFSGEVDQLTGRMLYTGEIRPLRGSWLEFAVLRDDTVTVKIDRKRKFPATLFARIFGLETDEAIENLFSNFVASDKLNFPAQTLARDPTKSKEEALLEFYRRMKPGDPLVLENAQALFYNMFFNPRRYSLGSVGRYKAEKKLKEVKAQLSKFGITSNPTSTVLEPSDFIAALVYLLKLTQGDGKIDDIDHLGNRRVRRVGELVQQNAFRVGILRLERVIKERMSLISTDGPLPAPSTLINARPVIAAVNEFFRSSQLSTILDQTNPLSELDNLRRLTVMGTGGITRERASFSIRDINHSQYSRIDPIRSPEGPNIGLVTYLSLLAKVNQYGFLEAPYRKVVKVAGRAKVTDEIVYLAADDEENYYITHVGIKIGKTGFIEDEIVPVRYAGEFLSAPSKLVDFIDVISRQIVGTSASLIPFLAHDEANRALMGTHMQCQAVPLVKPETPVIGTGMESVVADNMGRVVKSPVDGKVTYVDCSRVSVKPKKGDSIEFPIKKFVRTPQSTCFSQKPKVVLGQKIKKGDILIDGPAVASGELSLGVNLLIAYMSFEGLGYEDAIVISDRLVREDVLTSVHIEEHDCTVVDTKLGPEETTRDIPNVSEEELANLDNDGIVVVGSQVGPSDILVGKIAPKGETELSAEERLLRAIFGEKAREVRDTSLRMPHGEKGTIIDVQIFERDAGEELEPGVLKKIIVKVAQLRKVVVGDKLAGRHGNKGVISKIVPSADMPFLANGSPVDIIISPLSVLSRMNLGQLLEAHLGWAAAKLGLKVRLPVFEELPEEELVKILKKAKLPVDGKVRLFYGKTGQAYDQPIVVGTAYIMKLIHMVEDKTHARSTGPYSLITQQPLGGKAQMGGQRLGEMEVWALEAYGAAHTLQEMLTIKSDDIAGRAKAFEAIIKGTEIPQATVPESFKVLVKELNSLGLKVEMIGERVTAEREVTSEADEKIAAAAAQLAAESGAAIVAKEGKLSGMEIEGETK